MGKGSHSKVDFAAFRADKFVAHFFGGIMRCVNGCGSTVLSLLSGVNPLAFPERKDWNRKYVISFLKERGFKIAQLTAKNVTNVKEVTYPIGPHHVILARIKYIKNEASWVVIHNNKLYHNFEISDFRSYEFVNHPVLSMYLIKHPSWDTSKDEKREAGVRFRARYGLPPAKGGKGVRWSPKSSARSRRASKGRGRRSRSKSKA